MFDKIKIRSGIPIPPLSTRSHLSVTATKMNAGDPWLMKVGLRSSPLQVRPTRLCRYQG